MVGLIHCMQDSDICKQEGRNGTHCQGSVTTKTTHSAELEGRLRPAEDSYHNPQMK